MQRENAVLFHPGKGIGIGGGDFVGTLSKAALSARAAPLLQALLLGVSPRPPGFLTAGRVQCSAVQGPEVLSAAHGPVRRHQIHPRPQQSAAAECLF